MLLNYGVEEDSWESLDSKGIKLVNAKGDQSWIFIGRTDVEAEAPILWPLDVKSQLIRIDPDAGKDWRQEEKGTTEDEMIGWHHQLNGHELDQTLGNSEGQGGLACCSPWGWKESDTIEWLNLTELGFPTLTVMLFASRNNFISSFPICVTFISFFNWLELPDYFELECRSNIFALFLM